jgi:hypothetical protein
LKLFYLPLKCFCGPQPKSKIVSSAGPDYHILRKGFYLMATCTVTKQTAFNAGVAAERERAIFAINLRKAIARALQNRAEGSHDPVAVALLEQKEKEIAFEAALPPPREAELTQEQRDFADRLTRKIAQGLGLR